MSGRATHWISLDYSPRPRSSVTDILRMLKFDPLQEIRHISSLVFLYTMLHNHVPVPVFQMNIMRTHQPT